MVVGTSIGGYFGKSTRGIFSHEFGHIMGLGHVGDVMHFANTSGKHILLGRKTIGSTIKIHGPTPTNYTLEDYKDYRWNMREIYKPELTHNELVDLQANDWYDFRTWN